MKGTILHLCPFYMNFALTSFFSFFSPESFRFSSAAMWWKNLPYLFAEAAGPSGQSAVIEMLAKRILEVEGKKLINFPFLLVLLSLLKPHHVIDDKKLIDLPLVLALSALRFRRAFLSSKIQSRLFDLGSHVATPLQSSTPQQLGQWRKYYFPHQHRCWFHLSVGRRVMIQL